MVLYEDSIFCVYKSLYSTMGMYSICVLKCVFMCLCLCVCVCVRQTHRETESSLYTLIDMIKLSSLAVTIYSGYLHFNILIQTNYITLYLIS